MKIRNIFLHVFVALLLAMLACCCWHNTTQLRHLYPTCHWSHVTFRVWPCDPLLLVKSVIRKCKKTLYWWNRERRPKIKNWTILTSWVQNRLSEPIESILCTPQSSKRSITLIFPFNNTSISWTKWGKSAMHNAG